MSKASEKAAAARLEKKQEAEELLETKRSEALKEAEAADDKAAAEQMEQEAEKAAAENPEEPDVPAAAPAHELNAVERAALNKIVPVLTPAEQAAADHYAAEQARQDAARAAIAHSK